MRILPITLLCLLSSVLFGQKGKDVSETLLANWKKGETKTILITRAKEKSESGKPTPPFNFSYNAIVTVLDSSADGYKMRWIFELEENFKKQNPGIEQGKLVYDGTEFLFTTTETGEFKDLLNWEEVRDAYMEMTLATIPKKTLDDKAHQATMEKVKAMFSTKSLVESALAKEVLLYHAPYGGEFTTKGITTPSLLPNPFGGASMPSVTSQKLTSFDPGGQSYTAIFSQELDSSGTNIMMESVFKAMDLPRDSIVKYAKDMLANFQVLDHNEYHIVKSTGWIKELKYTRKAFAGEMKQTETITFKMKKD